MIELNTLGDAAIRIGEREIRPTSPAVFAALLYLGVERGRKVPRTALQELLFPETDERSGAHSLRQLLYKLRQLGASIQAEGDVVWLAAEDVSDDYSAPAHANGDGTSDGHSTGPFLYGYAPRLSPAFSEWLEAQRATVEVNRRRALIKQMLGRRDAADWPGVERFAQEVLTSDPFNEEATLALAESTALAGSKSEAIRILERYESETGRADLKLPAQVLRRRISERLPDRRRRALDTPFVGREAEAQAMREAIVQLRAGHGGSIVISGEPGIGKTRLIEETTALALLEGVNVHVVRCQPHYVNRPMGVFIEWVQQLMTSRGSLGVEPRTLEHLQLLTSHRDNPEHRPQDARDDVTRLGTLLAGIRDLVDAVASEAPILLVVEDAHWADQTSLRELCLLLDRRRQADLLLVLSTRNLEPLSQVGLTEASVYLFRLRALVDHQMATLATHLLGVSGPVATTEAVRDWCVRTAAGNPLFLQLLCSHYDDTRQPFAVPPGIRAATRRRVEQLPAEPHRLLELCAVLNQHTELGALSALGDIGPHAFLSAIRCLEEGGYLRTTDGSARLGHELLRECVLELVPPLSRQILHGIVATHLEAKYDQTPTSALLWDCAEHWAASGDLAKARTFVSQCAAHASNIGQAAQAVALLKLASRFASNDQERIVVLDELAKAATAAGQWYDLAAAVEKARTYMLGGISLDAAAAWQWDLREIEARLGSRAGVGSPVDRTDATKRLLNCAQSPLALPRLRTHATYLLLRIAHEEGLPELGHSAYEAVASLLRPDSLDYFNRMVPLVYHICFGDLALARQAKDALWADVDRFPIAESLRIARNLITAMGSLGESEEAEKYSKDYYGRATRLDLEHWKYDFASHCCNAAVNSDRFGEAQEWFDLAQDARTKSSATHLDFGHHAAGLDLAIHFRNAASAKERLSALVDANIGTSVRLGLAIQAYRVRVDLLDPTHAPSNAELAHARSLANRAYGLGCGDLAHLALCETLIRRGMLVEAKEAAVQYLATSRRDLGQTSLHLVRIANT